MMTTSEHDEPEPERPGTFVKTIRYQMKLTQRDLAEKLGVHPRSVSNWETGTVTPTPAKLKQLHQLIELWQQSEQHWPTTDPAGQAAYYVMTIASHEPKAILGTLRTMKRRLDAMTADVEALIAQFEHAPTTPVTIVEPKDWNHQ